VLAVMIDLDRLSRFLATLAVGRSGAAFILRPDGLAAAVPDPEADEVNGTRLRDPTPLAVARQDHRERQNRRISAGPSMSETRVLYDGVAYSVAVAPLDFMGWEVVTVIPEAEFLGEIERTMRHLTFGLLVLVLLAVGLSTLLARSLLARPLARIAAELGHVQRFELEAIRRHPSRLAELDALSNVIASMATGLTAFRKYLPADLVRSLIAEGIEARPGGTIQPLSILFADIAGFTGLSERMGDAVVPLLARHIDLMSEQIDAARGTIDKFIGDAVMAFWGAPAADAAHALQACRAALACREALNAAAILDDRGRPLRVRIGINSGRVLVGNIGSDRRLNYTAIGDAVNVASRIEGANTLYGTDIIIGETTRAEAGAAILVRELDRVTLYGRQTGTALFELLGLAEPGAAAPAWTKTYAAGLAAYRARHFAEAIEAFGCVVAERNGDAAAALMVERCRAFIAAPPLADWTGTTMLDGKG
jgi:adenylate cyclase